MVIDAPCLDCGEAMRIEIRDGVILGQEPEEICGYVDLPVRQWASNWPYT